MPSYGNAGRKLADLRRHLAPILGQYIRTECFLARFTTLLAEKEAVAGKGVPGKSNMVLFCINSVPR